VAFILPSGKAGERHCIAGNENSFRRVAIWFASGLIRLVCAGCYREPSKWELFRPLLAYFAEVCAYVKANQFNESD